LLSGAPAVIHFSGHVIGNGAQVSEAGSKLGVEGMVSKQVDRPYSRNFVQLNLRARHE
jgi:ATP-dependent DNA ligase